MWIAAFILALAVIAGQLTEKPLDIGEERYDR